MKLPVPLPRKCLQPVQLVRLDPVRSAEPRRNSSSIGAKALIAFCEALSVAMVSALSLVLTSTSAACAFQLTGRSPLIRRSNSAASFGNAALYSANLLFHSFSRPAPLVRASHASYTCLGLSKGGYFQPLYSRVAATSASPSAAPCTSCVSALLGEPMPMMVLQQISVGLSVTFFPALIAASTASGSWPFTETTCQP